MKATTKSVIFILCFSLISFSVCQAQEKMSLNVGTGVYISGTVDENGHDMVGPMIGAEFNWQFNQWFSAGANLSLGVCKEGFESRNSDMGFSLRGYVRPFARKFKLFELGVGVSGSYLAQCGNLIKEMPDDWIYREFRIKDYCLFGFDFPIRLYVIDNQKYRLLIHYDMKPVFSPYGGFLWTHSTAGLMFGVKF